jgi:methionine-rich copper-binding protein CopC
MTFRRLTFALIVGTTFILPVAAHTKLVAADPAADAITKAPAVLSLAFSEKIDSEFSGVELRLLTMPGMQMDKPMPVSTTAAVGADGMSLLITPRETLEAGTYSVTWNVVTSDTHRVEGTYSFTVE